MEFGADRQPVALLAQAAEHVFLLEDRAALRQNLVARVDLFQPAERLVERRRQAFFNAEHLQFLARRQAVVADRCS